MSAVQVGFVGTGAMGTAMVSRLLGAGYDVIVHNRTRANARSLEAAGARWATDPAAVAASCEVVLSCLRDTTAVESVYLGPHGLLAGAPTNQVLVEHGTFAPDLARRVADRAAEVGATFLDAPVTGGPDGASAGRLTTMIGGDAAALDAVREVLGAYSAVVTRVGPSGAGLELKLVNQLLVSVHMAVAGEAVALVRRLGIDHDLAAGVLTNGWGNSTMLRRTMHQVAEGRLQSTGVTTEGMCEVQNLVSSLLNEAGVQAPVFASSRQTFDTAVRAGRGASDPAALAQASVRSTDDVDADRRI